MYVHTHQHVNKCICITSCTNTPQHTQELALYRELAGMFWNAGLSYNEEIPLKRWKEVAPLLAYVSNAIKSP